MSFWGKIHSNTTTKLVVSNYYFYPSYDYWIQRILRENKSSSIRLSPLWVCQYNDFIKIKLLKNIARNTASEFKGTRGVWYSPLQCYSITTGFMLDYHVKTSSDHQVAYPTSRVPLSGDAGLCIDSCFDSSSFFFTPLN